MVLYSIFESLINTESHTAVDELPEDGGVEPFIKTFNKERGYQRFHFP